MKKHGGKLWAEAGAGQEATFLFSLSKNLSVRHASQAPILVVEDNPEDFAALSRAFGAHAVPNPVVRCENGEQALDYLLGHGRHPAWPTALPELVLLSLNMPGLDGRDVLKALKGDPALHVIPVIIFTTSANARDVEECYRLGANSYFTKPMSYRDLEAKVGLLTRYWLQACKLPHYTQPLLL